MSRQAQIPLPFKRRAAAYKTDPAAAIRDIKPSGDFDNVTGALTEMPPHLG